MVPLTNGATAAATATGLVRQSIADLTTEIKLTKGEVPPPLVGSSTTVIGDDLYVFGGRVASNRQMTNYLYVLHFPTLTWVRHIAPPNSAKAPAPRYFHSASVYQDRYIVIFGGMGNVPGRRTRQQQFPQEEKLCAMDDVSMFDIETMSWIEINVSPSIFTPQARYAHLSTVWDSNKLVIIGGQDIANVHINEVNVFDLTKSAWIHGGSMNGPYDAYRAIAFCPSSKSDTASYGGETTSPFWNMNTNQEKMEKDSQDSSISPVCIYSNYNFNDLTRDLQSFIPMKSSRDVEFRNHASEMPNSLLPPGLRFPTGDLMGHYFVVSGTFLSSTQSGFQTWALNLTNLSWTHIDTCSSLSSGSWNRGFLYKRKYYVLGHTEHDLKDDYNFRRINFDHVATIDLEAFGIYSLPPTTCSADAQELGLSMLNEPSMSDLTIWTTDQQSISANTVILAERWPEFAQLLTDQKNSAKNKLVEHTQIQRKQLLFPETYSVTLAFLQYIYTDHLITAQQHQPHILSRLLVLADMYNMERLKQLATYALHQLLTISTASMVYETATLTFQISLQVRSLRIMMNAKRILLNQQHQQQQQQQKQHHQVVKDISPPSSVRHHQTEHQEWPSSSLPLSPSNSITVPGSNSGSYYSSDEPMSPRSLPSSPPTTYASLRRLAQPILSPSSSEKTQQKYAYFNTAKMPLSPPLGSKKYNYFDQSQYNSSSRSAIIYH